MVDFNRPWEPFGDSDEEKTDQQGYAVESEGGEDDGSREMSRNSPREGEMASSEQLRRQAIMGRHMDNSNGRSKKRPSLEDLENKAGAVGKNGAAPFTSQLPFAAGAAGGAGLVDRTKMFLSMRKKSVAAGGAGLGIATTVLFGASFLAGPLQFMHFAQLIEDFHMFENEEFGDSRMGKMYRYARWPANPEMRRLGVVQRKVTTKFEADLKAKGFEVRYNNAGIADDIIRIDLDTGARSSMEFDGKKLGDMDGATGNSQRRRAFKSVMRQAGMSTWPTSMSNRSQLKKMGINLRPLGNVKRRIDETEFKYRQRVKEELEKRIKNGSKGPAGDFKSSETDPDGPEGEKPAAADVDADTVAAAEGAGSDIADAYNDAPGDVDAKLEAGRGALRSKMAKGIGGVGAAVGILCLMNGIAQSAEQAEVQKSITMIRIAMDILSVGSQLMAGDGVDMNELAALSELLYSEEAGSWYEARIVEAEEGKPQKGPDVIESAKIGKKNRESLIGDVADFIESITPDFVCDFAGSLLGTITLTITDIAVSGVTSGLGSVAVGQLLNTFVLGPFADWAIREISGDAIPGLLEGADRGNVAMVGGRLAANNQGANLGGVPMSGGDELAWNIEQNIDRKLYAKEKSIYQRYFAITDAHSLAGQSLRTAPKSVDEAVTQVASLFNIRTITTNLVAAVTGVSYAQTTTGYDYGFPKIAFTVAEMDDPRFENPLDNAQKLNAAAKAEGKTINDYHADWGKKCFNVNVVEGDGESPDVTITPAGNQEKYVGELDEACLDEQRTKETYQRYRFYLGDLMISESLNCAYGDNQSCKNTGNDKQGGTTTPGASGGVVTGEARDLARQITENPNITYDYGPEGRIAQQFKQIANGENPAPCGKEVHPKLLGLILAIAKDNKLQISSLTAGRDCTSLHGQGRAVDIDFYDGQGLTGNNAPSDALIDKAIAIIDAGQRIEFGNCDGHTRPANGKNVHFFSDNCNHVHIELEGI